MSITPSARSVAIDLVGAVLRRKRPLDDAIEDNPDMALLPTRDRAFARLLVATVLRRLGQIDALIAHCLNTPLPPRAAVVHDMLRLGITAEGRHLARQGFRQILLVAGEHPKFVSRDYLAECVRALEPDFSSISIEVGPMETRDYEPVVTAGADGVVAYQETYNRAVYAEMHTAGPKRDFNFRLDCAERGYRAGFRRLGIGVLFGLSPWQQEAIALAAHLEYLLKHCWQAQISVSLPRLRPAAGGFRPLFSLTDRELAQLVCALRITFPQVGIVLSTRERSSFRDSLVHLGVTMMSAGSHTEPGGYTRQGGGHLHRTVRGRIVAPDFQDGEDRIATGQFEISDERSPAEIADALRRRGFEPVWKDWDQALCGV